MFQLSRKSLASLTKQAAVQYMPFAPVASNPLVFLDITVEREHIGRVTIELFNDLTPQCAENFRSLCTGERGISPFNNVTGGHTVPLHYRGIPFHRIIPNYIVQGGDIMHKDGRGNLSAFGYPFAPVSETAFSGKCRRHLPGTVALAHSNPSQLGSQFFFNLARSSHLDGKFPIVGQVIDGWDCIRVLSKCGSRSGTPVTRGWVNNCGQSGGVEAEELAALDNERDMMATRKKGKEVLEMLSGFGV